MEILGLVFAGSATARRPEMARFVADVLGLEPAPAGGASARRPGVRGVGAGGPRWAPAPAGGVSADMFALPDGAFFAVAGPREMGETSRTIGFLVGDLEPGVEEPGAAGV